MEETNEMAVAQVGRFRSRFGDGMTLRRGVKDHVFLRSIRAITHGGDDMKHVCYVECPPNENWLKHNEDRLLPVMRLLEKGRQAIIAEQLGRKPAEVVTQPDPSQAEEEDNGSCHGHPGAPRKP